MAAKLVELGAIPITLSDMSGYVHEPDGFNERKLSAAIAVKADRGSRLGRYILASTSAKFVDGRDDQHSMFDIPCNYVFACSGNIRIDSSVVNKLSQNGCSGIFEGSHRVVEPEAVNTLMRKDIAYGPYRASTLGSCLVNNPSTKAEVSDAISGLEARMAAVHSDVKATCKEFNCRGDLNKGTNIASFMRVADVMISHGAN